MKKLLALSLIAVICGCQTRITAEKYPEQVTVVGDRFVVTSGGWRATARSPLWADESLDGLSIGVSTNGTVTMGMQHYDRDLSSNAVLVVKSLSELTADVAGKVAAAVCAYYGGGAVTATSKLGEMTIKDITGRVQAKLAKSGITDETAAAADSAALAQEVCKECVAATCPDCEAK